MLLNYWCVFIMFVVFFFSKGNNIFNFPLLSSWSREDNWCGFTAKCPVAVAFHSELWRQQRTWLEIWKRGGVNFDLCQRHVPGYKLIYHAPTYLRLRATFGASNLFVSLMKAHLVSVSIFYLLSLCSFVSLTVRFIIFATCQFVTYLSDSWSFPLPTSTRVHYAWPEKALRL